jgi:hypothetical protein
MGCACVYWLIPFPFHFRLLYTLLSSLQMHHHCSFVAGCWQKSALMSWILCLIMFDLSMLLHFLLSRKGMRVEILIDQFDLLGDFHFFLLLCYLFWFGYYGLFVRTIFPTINSALLHHSFFNNFLGRSCSH